MNHSAFQVPGGVQVFDIDTLETLPGAHLQAVLPNGAPIPGVGGVTDADGIAHVPPGWYRASFVGYAPLDFQHELPYSLVYLSPGVDLPEVEIFPDAPEQTARNRWPWLLLLLAAVALSDE